MLAHRRPVYTSYAGKNEMIAVGAAFEDDAREETEDLPAKRESSDTYNRGLTAQHSRMPLDGAVVTEMAIWCLGLRAIYPMAVFHGIAKIDVVACFRLFRALTPWNELRVS